MRWLILFGLWLSYMSFGVVVTSIAPLVPVIQADLDNSARPIDNTVGDALLGMPMYTDPSLQPRGASFEDDNRRYGCSLHTKRARLGGHGRGSVRDGLRGKRRLPNSVLGLDRENDLHANDPVRRDAWNCRVPVAIGYSRIRTHSRGREQC